MGSKILVAASIGAIVGGADVLRLLLTRQDLDPGPHAVSTVLWYAAFWAAGGLFLELPRAVFRSARLPGRAATLLVLSAMLIVIGLAREYVGHGLFGALNLTITGVTLLASAVVLLVLRGRGETVLRPAVWAGLGACAVALSAVAAPVVAEPAGPVPESRADEHPSVLLVVVDTLRADHTSLHGFGRETTPNLDAFAKGALVFEQARAASSWTLTSTASYLTGLPPAVHTAESEFDRLPEDALSVAEVFRAAGYRTGLFSDNLFVSAHYGLARGFERVVDRLAERELESVGLAPRSLLGALGMLTVVTRTRLLGSRKWSEMGAPEISRIFLEWLDGLDDGAPWFAYLHYMEPHTPYDAPPPWNARFTDDPKTHPFHPGATDKGHAPWRIGTEHTPDQLRARLDAYDGEIAWWDQCFGELLLELERRGGLDRLVVFVTADHGESFFEHGTWGHHNSLYDELLHVPLLVRAPGTAPGRVAEPVSLLGLPASLLRAAEYEPPEPFARWCRPLLPGPDAGPGHARLLRRGSVHTSMVEQGRKWILSRRGEEEVIRCFDLAVDPGETRDLSDRLGPAVEKARETLLRREALELRRRLEGRRGEIERGMRSTLDGLGYLK